MFQTGERSNHGHGWGTDRGKIKAGRDLGRGESRLGRGFRSRQGKGPSRGVQAEEGSRQGRGSDREEIQAGEG